MMKEMSGKVVKIKYCDNIYSELLKVVNNNMESDFSVTNSTLLNSEIVFNYLVFLICEQSALSH